MFFSAYLNKFLIENKLNNTMENLRRFFASRYVKLPSEETINDIYLMIENIRKDKGGESKNGNGVHVGYRQR